MQCTNLSLSVCCRTLLYNFATNGFFNYNKKGKIIMTAYCIKKGYTYNNQAKNEDVETPC